MIKNLPVMNTWRPAKRRLAQGPWVEVKPEIRIDPNIAVTAPLNIELGGLPLSLGLFAGSGLSFYLRSQVPTGWPRTAALLVGAGLAVAGVANLILPKKKAATVTPGGAAPGAPAPAIPLPQPSAPGGAPPTAGYSPSEAMAFENVTGRISHPGEGTAIDLWWWEQSYPFRVQLFNRASVPVSFELEMTAEEFPDGGDKFSTTSLPINVSLAPGEVRDVDGRMSLVTNSIDFTEVRLFARKRRVPRELAQMLDYKTFDVD